MGTFDRAGLFFSHCDSVSVTVMCAADGLSFASVEGLLISSVIVKEIAMCWPVGEGGRRQGMPNRHFEGKDGTGWEPCKGTCNIKQTLGLGTGFPNTKRVPCLASLHIKEEGKMSPSMKEAGEAGDSEI